MEILTVERVVENTRTPTTLIVADKLTILEDNGKSKTEVPFGELTGCVPISDFSFALARGAQTFFFFAQDAERIVELITAHMTSN